MDLLLCFKKGFVLGDLAVLVAEAKKEAYRKVLKFWYELYFNITYD